MLSERLVIHAVPRLNGSQLRLLRNAVDLSRLGFVGYLSNSSISARLNQSMILKTGLGSYHRNLLTTMANFSGEERSRMALSSAGFWTLR